MCTKDENGSRRHQFVSEETSKAEMKEEGPIRGIRNFNEDGDEKGSSCNNEKKKKEASNHWRVTSNTITTGSRKGSVTVRTYRRVEFTCNTQQPATIQVQLQQALELYRTRKYSERSKKPTVCR